MSSFGRVFRVSTFGESHCKGVGCIVDGVPPRMKLVESDVQPQLTRRRPGQSKLSTKRNEADEVTIMSGTECGFTLGTPIAMFVANKDHRPTDYTAMNDVPRPSHADYTYQEKYGVRASSGGGRASARETIGRVAAGAIAEKWLAEKYGTEVVAWVSAVETVVAPAELETQSSLTRADVDETAVRCPHPSSAQEMVRVIEQAKKEEDSVGGVVTCVIRNVPAGLGEPCFDKLEALLAHAMLSIPATKGFEIGSGFQGTRMRGSAHNDLFASQVNDKGQLETMTNRSGGIQGGISNGMNIVLRVAFKPPATISKDQDTADYKGAAITLSAKGRHDPCVVPRAVPIVEAMAALVLADAAMVQESRVSASSSYALLGRAGDPAHAAAAAQDPKAATSSGTAAAAEEQQGQVKKRRVD